MEKLNEIEGVTDKIYQEQVNFLNALSPKSLFFEELDNSFESMSDRFELMY